MADLSRTGSIIPQWPEVRGYFKALWLLSKGDARGLQAFDISDREVLRSLCAILWALPAVLLLNAAMRPEFTSSIAFVAKSLFVVLVWWAAAIAALALMTLLLDLRPVLRTLIIAFNWISLAMAWAALPSIALEFLDRAISEESILLKLVISVGMLLFWLPFIVLPWRIVRTITGRDWLIRALIFASVILIPLAVTLPLTQYLGIIPR